MDYYLRTPALTILFYPPLFALVEALFFAVFDFLPGQRSSLLLCLRCLLRLGPIASCDCGGNRRSRRQRASCSWGRLKSHCGAGR